MKNKDMPAMPLVMDNGHPFHESDVAFANEKLTMGLTKREMFAMNAPECPKPVKKDFINKHQLNDKLVKVTRDDAFLTSKGALYLIKERRYAYADMMLEELS